MSTFAHQVTTEFLWLADRMLYGPVGIAVAVAVAALAVIALSDRKRKQSRR